MPDVLPKKRPRRKLRARELKQQTAKRKEQMKGILEEARLWTLAISLPSDLISEEREYRDDLNRIASAIFGHDYDEDKIKWFFQRMGMELLSPGTPEEAKSNKTSPRWSRMQLLHKLDNEIVPASILYDVYKECPDFRSKYRGARTWKEVKQCAAPFKYHGNELLESLETAQFDHARYAYGSNGRVGVDDVGQIRKLLKSPNQGSLFTQDDGLFLSHDFVSICTDRQAFMTEPPCGTMSQWSNVMELYPSFFEDATMDKGMRDIHFFGGCHDVQSLISGGNQTSTIIHELAHSRSLLACDDSVIYLTYAEWDEFSKRRQMKDREWSHGEILKDQQEKILIAEDDDNLFVEGRYHKAVPTYGLDLAFLLARRHEANGSRKPEDCAESWEIYAKLRTLLVVYPDYDFLPFYRHPKERNNLSPCTTSPDDSGYGSRSENGDESDDDQSKNDLEENRKAKGDTESKSDLQDSGCANGYHNDRELPHEEDEDDKVDDEDGYHNNIPEYEFDRNGYPEYLKYTVQGRYNLAHHWTGLDCLRNPEHGSIRNDPRYDPSKDAWAQKFGNKKFTIEETLDIILKNVKYYARQEELANQKIELKEKLRTTRSSHDSEGPFAAASKWCDPEFPPFDLAEMLNLEKADWLKDILQCVSDIDVERPYEDNGYRHDGPRADAGNIGVSSNPCASGW